ncbi:MAG: PadR family transcriptional regulator, partial [Lachnospiraceae bacterium]
LMHGDFYGYQLSQLVCEYSDRMLSMPEGSLYPSLYRMEELGYVTSTKKLVGKRLERIYYHIEPSGKEYLKKLISDYDYINEAIHKIMNHKEAR